MEIIFNFPHVFSPDSDPVENAYVLKASLDYLVRVNLIFLRNHVCPALYRSGVVYGRTIKWEPIPALFAPKERGRAYGDCKSLSAALIAEYYMQGKESKPVFRFVRNAKGGLDFHILVETIHGVEDPSKVLGMGKNENERFYLPGTQSY